MIAATAEEDDIKLRAAIKIQTLWRAYVVRAILDQWHVAATMVQSAYRGHFARHVKPNTGGVTTTHSATISPPSSPSITLDDKENDGVIAAGCVQGIAKHKLVQIVDSATPRTVFAAKQQIYQVKYTPSMDEIEKAVHHKMKKKKAKLCRKKQQATNMAKRRTGKK